MKKILPIALVTILVAGLVLLTLPNAFAEHTTTTVWMESGSDVLAVSPITWPRWLNFTVTNDGPDGLKEIKFVIQKDDDGNALFKFENSKHGNEAANWTAIPDEFGPDNYPTVIYFKAEPSGNPIITDSTGEFDIRFSDGPTKCNYQFDLWTSDDGAPSGVGHDILKVIIDGELPALNLITPNDGQEIDAIFDPYPNEYYLKIDFTAADNPDHDSNICRIIVDIAEVGEGPEWDISYEYEPEVEEYLKLWHNRPNPLPEGNYTLTVKVYDCAGNCEITTIEFKFKVPWLVRPDPYKGTVGPKTTYDPETGLYTGSIYTYAKKTLGTEVTIETKAGAFTPNSKVNVTVNGLPYANYALVLKNIATDSEGKFTEEHSFLFPTAPQGDYTVIFNDADDTIVDLKFTVIPEIIYKPVIIIGPAPIEAIATGLPAEVYVQRFTCNNTDALLGTNRHVLDWYTDVNGTLQTPMADNPGFLMPVLESGTYEIGLDHAYGKGYYTGSISNYLYVVSAFDELSDKLEELQLDMDFIKPKIVKIEDDVAYIASEVGNIEIKLDNLQPVIARIDGNVVEINTTLGLVKGIIMSIEDDVAVIRGEGDEWDIRVKIDGIITPMPTYLGAILSAIAAIASITAVVVVVKRLKVAA
ncbi:hypothetical protein KAU92_01750 [Candidatus Bathyarchaeota archaeon]|nr:hypothetical protein [Candidatus Bathyarchaeota archaeon]